MATKRRYKKVKQTKRRYKRGGKQTKSNNSSLKRANRLHMAFGKQRAFAFASH